MKFGIFFLVLFANICSSQNHNAVPNFLDTKEMFYNIGQTQTLCYQKPKWSDLVNKIPHNFASTIQDFVSDPYYPYGIIAITSTGLLLPFDPWFITQSRRLGDDLGLNPHHSHIMKVVPADINTALYFVGNGMSVILISGGLATYGLLKNDYRAQSTAIQLLESIAISGLFVQPLKRLTGRESPFITEHQGREHSNWVLAPSFSAYQKDTSHYDAMPSGHLTTAMAALTVLFKNYPEKKWIKPVGYTLLTLMCFEMMQSKVHWISDYPLALFIGYLIGKNIAQTRITKPTTEPSVQATKYHIRLTGSTFNGYHLVGVNINF